MKSWPLHRPIFLPIIKSVCGVRSREVLPPVQVEDELPSPKGFDAPNQPRVNINRQEARGYCQWLGGDLMTEAQWEKAAKGGRDLEYPTADGKRPTKDSANYNYFFGKTVAVNSYDANPFGLHNMAGNVWEWVLDNYDRSAYAYLSAENPINLKETGPGVLRGGGWGSNNGVSLRAALRNFGAPTVRVINIGARCALSPEDLNQ